jgi:GTP-binding protein
VAIVGRPNVGKSTLFNRLLRQKKAIVDDQPGVTRDRNYETVTLAGRPVTLVDTGGFDALDASSVMSQVREQTLLALEEADLTVVLCDGREGLNPNDRELVEILRRGRRPFVLAVNKVDGPEHEDLANDFWALGVEEVHPVSAAHGFGVNTLLAEIVDRLPDLEEPPPREDQVRVAIIGRPNVGKSSLINQLLGQQRALVDHEPGTTRDPLDVEVTRDGRSYLFVDTAGIRRKGRVNYKIEKFAVMRALKALERCDVALCLIDSVEGVTDQDAHVAGYALERGRGLILVFNKWDLVKDKRAALKDIEAFFDLKLRFAHFAPYVTASAKTGLRVTRVFKLIDQVFQQYTTRVSTPRVNKVLEQALAEHAPAYVGRDRLKILYGAQVSTRPPTFVLFANRPDKVHFSYRRYLTNALKKAFGLDKTPIKVMIKPRRKEKR